MAGSGRRDRARDDWHAIATKAWQSAAHLWLTPAADQPTDCWYSVKPIAAHTAATIQNRRMIFVSDHACSSK